MALYVPERVLKSRSKNGTTEYLIKWEGYSLQEVTWETPERMYPEDPNCEAWFDMLADWDERKERAAELQREKRRERRREKNQSTKKAELKKRINASATKNKLKNHLKGGHTENKTAYDREDNSDSESGTHANEDRESTDYTENHFSRPDYTRVISIDKLGRRHKNRPIQTSDQSNHENASPNPMEESVDYNPIHHWSMCRPDAPTWDPVQAFADLPIGCPVIGWWSGGRDGSVGLCV
eukprot:comp13079_c1_seq1/m.8371 comp13079_c1_seq1/g.8371  ORF comp13079_c1_seq1/g.8371 comp13079_c1_seq1/m.8371 type:complete len:238 (-) comp13079_c1_seq1:31-744(-)